jgi:hypothetical protein
LAPGRKGTERVSGAGVFMLLKGVAMAIRDLIPWSRGREMTVRRGEESNPLLTLGR